MERQLSEKLKVVEDGDRAQIVYVHPDGTQKNLLFNHDGVYINTSNAILTTAMPVAYSSAFQTATLKGTFMPIAALSFANSAGASWISTVTAGSTIYAIKTA